jgi:hypothetical protein
VLENENESVQSPTYVEIPSATDSPGRFAPASEPIGIDSDYLGYHVVHLAPGPVCWLRLMPAGSFARTFLLGDLEKAMKSPPPLLPLNRDPHGWNYLRGANGFGLYSFVTGSNDRGRALSVVFAFTKGEVWSIDTIWLKRRDDGSEIVPNVEHQYRQALTEYGQFLLRLDIRPPYKWTAGMDNLKGRLLYAPARSGQLRAFLQPNGPCLLQIVTESGIYSPDEPPGKTLRPFFTKLYDSCGVPREDWRDA